MFNLALANHPSVTATILQNNLETAGDTIRSITGILLPGTKDEMLDMQPGIEGYRLFCDYTEFDGVTDLTPEQLAGYFFQIENSNYQIVDVKILKTFYTKQIKFILLKNAS